MHRIFLYMLLVINIIVCFNSILPNYVTFARVYPKHITYDIKDKNSIDNAIIKAKFDSLEYGRDLFGSGKYILILLVILNFSLVVYLNKK